MKILPHVMRNINEFNIPSGNASGYEILYFGVNLILMFDYRLAFDIEVKNSDSEIEVLILSRKDIPKWKENQSPEINLYYSRSGLKINDVFKPTISDAYDNEVLLLEVRRLRSYFLYVRVFLKQYL
jgi:hypothetical protein